MPPEDDNVIENIDQVVDAILIRPKTAEKSTAKNGYDSETDDETDQEIDRSDTPPRVQAKEAPREPDEQGDPDDETYERREPSDEDDSDDEDVDVDSIELEVTVDGETRRVPIKELKEKYSAEGAIDKRLQEVTEGRTKVIEQSNQLNGVLTHMSARLQALDGILEQAQQLDVDLNELRVKDPTRYLFEKERIREIQEKRDRIAREQANINTQQEDLRRAALIEHSRNEFRKLSQIDKNFADPRVAPLAMKRLYDGSSRYKFTPQEVAAVVDHRVLLALSDAVSWQEHLARQNQERTSTTKARQEPRPLLKPGVKKSDGRSREQKEMKALRAKARETGKPDDVAKTLLVRAPGPRR